MREILFRGKRADNGEWVYGHPFTCDEYEFSKIAQMHQCDKHGYWSLVNIIHTTLGQYTGLLDKNGVKIFEGDVHEYFGNHFVVKFGHYVDEDTKFELYGWHLDGVRIEHKASLQGDSEMYVNIIGNIHENPELLEVEE